MNDTSLVGTWRLACWYNEVEGGSRDYPMGEDAIGHISYSSDGYVFVHIMTADRALYAENDPFGGSPEEDSAAVKSHLSYSGRYEDRGDHVIHHVEIASCPNWAGTQQVRKKKLEGQSLYLSAEATQFQGREVTAVLRWDRVN